jgi:hypothetical protein
MIVAGYALDLYCDNYLASRKFDNNLIDEFGHRWDAFPVQYTGELGSKCRKQARKAGWLLNFQTGQALCPHCNKAGVTLKSLHKVA